MTTDQSKLINAVRDWTHFDTLYENHSSQANNAKLLRTTSEQIIIAILNESRMAHSIIRVSGATLTLVRQPVPTDLTWEFIEREILIWLKSKDTHKPTLITWLHDRQKQNVSERLKKTLV